ncbi:MAG: 23S rRNA (pseudouridine1915-N3)-methyltransferase [Gammaproteobacteria bacterium]|jgi:23S rRNA (pseudouridine1915-N3)-methyltransferase
MQIQIVSVGQKMPAWVDTVCADYIKRMPRELPIQITSIPLAHRKNNDVSKRPKQQESQQILKKLVPGSLNIALDEHGKQWSSIEWSQQLEHWMFEYPRVNLVIGGPDGLAEDCRAACAQTIALGRMTMPHALVRVVLVEQLYRAWTLLQGHPYHRE